jgi:hypothetical protein
MSQTWLFRLVTASVATFACSGALLSTPASAATAAGSTGTKNFTSVTAKKVLSTSVKRGTSKRFSTQAPKRARGVFIALHVGTVKSGGTIKVCGVGKGCSSKGRLKVSRKTPTARTIFVPLAANRQAVIRSSARAKVVARLVGYTTTARLPKLRSVKQSTTLRRVAPKASRVLSLEGAPRNATAVVADVTTYDSARSGVLTLCSTKDTTSACRSTVRAVALKGKARTTSTVVPLLGASSLRVAASGRTTTKVNVRGYVVPSPAKAVKPAPSPAAGTAGIRPGTVLKKHYGDMTITTPGTVLTDMEIYGRVSIKAANVTIKNSRIRAQKATSSGIVNSKASGVLLQDVEIFSDLRNPDSNGIMGWGFTLNRVQIRNVVDQVHIHGSNVTIRNSWLHSNTHYVSDPNWGGKPTHDDNIQITAGSNITIEGTVLEDSHSAAVMMGQDQGIIGDITLSKNTIGGGACSVNIAEKGRGPLKRVNIRENTFTRTQTKHAGCAVITERTTSPILTSNIWKDGAVVGLRRG